MKAESPPYARVVVDTNVLLGAALLPQSVPARLVDSLLQTGKLVFTDATFAELETRLWKPKFDRYLSMEHRKALLHDFSASGLWVSVPPEIAKQTFSRDMNDDAFIHAALAASSSRLITGDEDLLCLHPLQELSIITPRAALDELLAFSLETK